MKKLFLFTILYIIFFFGTICIVKHLIKAGVDMEQCYIDPSDGSPSIKLLKKNGCVYGQKK